jgi:cystatin-C
MRFAIPFVFVLVAQVGGFLEIAVTDKGAVAAADFAIEAKKKTDKIALDKIVKAESQVVAGINYRLLLAVKTDDGVRQAEVVVWHKLDRSNELTRWDWKGDAKK